MEEYETDSDEATFWSIERLLASGSLKDRQEAFAYVSSNPALDQLDVLLPCALRYSDRTSRSLLFDAVNLILKQGPHEPVEIIAKWAESEIARVKTTSGQTLAPSIRVAIVNLLCLALSSQPPATLARSLPSLLASLAYTFASLAQDDNFSTSALHRSALVVIRRTFRNQADLISPSIKCLCTVKPEAINAPLLGVLVAVSIRLKNRSDGNTLVEARKSDLLSFYHDRIVFSKNMHPEALITALEEFVEHFVTAQDLQQTLLATFDKMLLRSPELILPVLASFFKSFGDQECVSTLLKTKYTATLLNLAKSTQPPVRAGAIVWFQALASHSNVDAVEAAATEFSTVLTNGKSASTDQRAVLFKLLSGIHLHDSSVPQKFVTALEALLPKETAETTLLAMMDCLKTHLSSVVGSAPKLAAALSKSMQDTKPNIRKIVCVGLAQAIFAWPAGKDKTIPNDFAVPLLPALEANLKNATTNMLNNATGPLEGYAAVALLYGPLKEHASKVINGNPVTQGILNIGLKPSFILWDKLYRKFAGEDDCIWLVRAVTAVALREPERVIADGPLATEVALPLLFVLLEAKSHHARLEAFLAFERMALTQPRLAYELVSHGLETWLVKHNKGAGDDGEHSADASWRIKHLLTIVAPTSEGDHTSAILCGLLVPAHHPTLGKHGLSLWANLLQQAGVAPPQFVEQHYEALKAFVWAALTQHNTALRQAALDSLATLALISPSLAVTDLLAEVKILLNIDDLNRYSETDLAIFQHPPNSELPYVDVLTAAKPKSNGVTKGKDQAIQQWEDEVRKSLQAKAKGVEAINKPTTKAERALVEAQLRKEAEIRSSIQASLDRVNNGLAIARSFLKSGIDTSTSNTIPSLMASVLPVATAQNARLVEGEFRTTWFALAQFCLRPLSDISTAAAIAILLASKSTLPLEEETPNAAALIGSILYRVHFATSRHPFSLETFSYLFPLLAAIVANGGVGLAKDAVEAQAEQIALAVDIIAQHCTVAENPLFPRVEMAHAFISALSKYPHCTKAATEAVIALGKALSSETPSYEEVQALLLGLVVEESHIRSAALQALEPIDLDSFGFLPELWIACHDVEERNVKIASQIQAEQSPEISERAFIQLLPFLESRCASVRTAAAKSINTLASIHPSSSATIVDQLINLYDRRNAELKPELDEYGLVIESTLNREDPWRARSAVMEALQYLSPNLPSATIVPVFKLFLEDGACADRHDFVRHKALQAAVRLVDDHGRTQLQALINIFQSILSAESKSEQQDLIVEATIVMYGRLAKHMQATDTRLTAILERLVSALDLPSETVQVAVSECFPALIKLRRNDAKELVEQLLRKLVTDQKYAVRRGAAYGLAGIIKGLGIASLKTFNIVGEIRTGLADKKSELARQGSMFLLECLATALGRPFEPFIVQILPDLLSALGDTNVQVREATQDASRVIMGGISSYGVKLILPTLLGGLDERQWRSKKGAIELLGNMAYLAPRQLAISLPTIIPRLSEALSDSHKEVRNAANASLKRLGEVATNPEIQAIQSVLLGALVNPAEKTSPALDTLTNTTFAHFIDSSSLALVIPIMDRGLKERSSEVKRKAARMVGMMATLTDAKDLSPYLSQLTPLIRGVLVDPVPETRGTAAQALGSLVQRLGEEQFPDLIQSLLEVLQSNLSGVDQQGAAQGLAEVVGGLGTERLDDLLPEVLRNTSSNKGYVREGFMSLLVFLPSVFGERFAPYLVKIISPILNGLADESDYVRDASMRAGRMIISSHSGRAVELLLPELEVGLLDSSWRIRQSSMQLVGELLFRLVGITAKAADSAEDAVEEPEEDRATAEASRSKLLEALGKERRDRVLAYIYIVRQDPSGVIRQLSASVWKALVHNTPRTVKEILPVLVNLLVNTLANAGNEQKETASRTLGELCRKLGTSILNELIPILQKATEQGVHQPRMRQGVCLAYVEIMQSSNEDQLEGHEPAIIAAVRSALVDEDENVRSAAALAFDKMQQFVGAKAIDETIPTLLHALQGSGPGAEAALGALREVISVRATAVIPVLVPTLTAQPISASNAKALGALVSIAGSHISKRLVSILTSLSTAERSQEDPEDLSAIRDAIKSLFSSIEDITALNSVLMHLLSLCKDATPANRVEGCRLFGQFCDIATVDHTGYDIDWIRQLVSLFDDRADTVVKAAWEAMSSLVKTIDKEDMEKLSVPLRRTIENTGTPGLAILLQGLLGGTAEQREQSAYGLSDLVQRTSPEALKPFVPQIAGPLIRIISERVPSQVKTAILTALTTLLTDAAALVRPFYPQIQRTFAKNVSDATSLSVRNRAAAGLGALMVHQPRVDPLVTELINGANSADSEEIRESFVTALGKVILNGGKNISAAVKPAILNFLEDSFAVPSQSGSTCAAVARVFSGFAKWDPSGIEAFLRTSILEEDPNQQISYALLALVEDAPDSASSLDLASEIATKIKEVAAIPSPHISRPARDARALLQHTSPFSEIDDGA